MVQIPGVQPVAVAAAFGHMGFPGADRVAGGNAADIKDECPQPVSYTHLALFGLLVIIALFIALFLLGRFGLCCLCLLYTSAPTGKKEKFNNRNNRRGQQFGRRRETEAERLQRIQLEKARNAPLKISIPDEITVGELATRCV